MNPFNDAKRQFTRREFFGKAACGIGGVALASLLDPKLMGSSTNAPAISGLPHFAPKAKRVIYLLQNGAPTHVDLFDYKPMLTKMQGEPVPPSILGEKRFSDMTNTKEKLLLPNVTKFNQVGKNGMWMSNYMPHLGEIVDELCFIRSMHTTHPNHEPAVFKFQSGRMIPGLPTLGSWVVYGLGSENQNLPAFVVLADPDARFPVNGVQNWHSGLLPPVYQGTPLRSQGSPLLNLKRETEPPFDVAKLERTLPKNLDNIHIRDRPAERSETTRPTRKNIGYLGRRVWPDAHRPDTRQNRYQHRWTGSQSTWFHCLDGWRRL